MSLLIAIVRSLLARATSVFGCSQELCYAFTAAADFKDSVHFAVIAGGRLFTNGLNDRRELFL